MANENARRDANRVTTALGVTNDANQEIRNLLIDPATGALLVTPAAGGGGLVQGAESGTYVNGVNVRLGTNPLLEDVVLDGDGQTYGMTFTGMDTVQFDDMTDWKVGTLNNVNNADIVGQDSVTLATSTGGMMNFATPNVKNAVANAGDVAVLINAITGEWDWSAAASLVPNMICDADQDTCVETERTPDDDTIRMKAGGVDVGTITSTTYDFEIGKYNTKLGNFLGFPGVGFEYTDGAKSAFVSVNELAGNGYIQTRVTNGTGDVSNTNTSPTTFAARAQNGAENSEIQITKDNLRLRHDSADFVNIADAAMTFDVASGDLFVNEGTTATGTNTALAGDALILQDPSTGEVKYGPVASPFFRASMTNAFGTVLFPIGTPNGTQQTYIYDTVSDADPRFSLNALTGEITCNVAGDYEIVMQNSLVSGGNGTPSIFAQGYFVNGVIGQAQLVGHLQTGDYRPMSQHYRQTLAVNDVITCRAIKLLNGTIGATSTIQNINNVIIRPA